MTAAAFLRRVGFLDFTKGNAFSLGFVRNKAAKLMESPGVSFRPVLTPDLCLVKEVGEVLHRYSFASRLCF